MYPFGVDPAWQIASNRLLMLNSLKMKTAFIMGMAAILFGLFLNLVVIKTLKEFLFVWLPRLLLFLPLFYLVFLIILKWVKFSGYSPDVRFSPPCAPPILPIFVGMMTRTPQPRLPPPCLPFMYQSQPDVEKMILGVTLISAALVILYGPLRYLFMSRKDSWDESTVIELVIHSVEYLLDVVAHPVSYLRLWALALAHEQMSEVTWSMLLGGGNLTAPFLALLVRAILMCLVTLFVLVAMEGFTVCLHALRLQWIEFGSKFVDGDGQSFQPVKLPQTQTLLDSIEEDPATDFCLDTQDRDSGGPSGVSATGDRNFSELSKSSSILEFIIREKSDELVNSYQRFVD